MRFDELQYGGGGGGGGALCIHDAPRRPLPSTSARPDPTPPAHAASDLLNTFRPPPPPRKFVIIIRVNVRVCTNVRMYVVYNR